MADDGCFDVIVVGGGAAGFFGAIELATLNPSLRIAILEKSSKLLSKVRISGGGRCNLTHHCYELTPLTKHYPRGQKELKPLFRIFQPRDTVKWFGEHGLKLKIEKDGRIFPQSDQSESVIECFLTAAARYAIKIYSQTEVKNISKKENKLFNLLCSGEKNFSAKRILIATGGHPKAQAYDWLGRMGHTIAPPIPSLFTFNDSQKKFASLMGLSVADAAIKIAGTPFEQQGPVLITHWGLSGPAVIRLSAWAAEHLHTVGYSFVALVNWTGEKNEEDVRKVLLHFREIHRQKKVTRNPLFKLPVRLWALLCSLAQIDEEMVWGATPKKALNRLVEQITHCQFQIEGKTTFKEEFVTCGGIHLAEVDLPTMESKKMKGIFFAGEVLHIDGETGGFNFQAAWTTAYLAAHGIVSDLGREQFRIRNKR